MAMKPLRLIGVTSANLLRKYAMPFTRQRRVKLYLNYWSSTLLYMSQNASRRYEYNYGYPEKNNQAVIHSPASAGVIIFTLRTISSTKISR